MTSVLSEFVHLVSSVSVCPSLYAHSGEQMIIHWLSCNHLLLDCVSEMGWSVLQTKCDTFFKCWKSWIWTWWLEDIAVFIAWTEWTVTMALPWWHHLFLLLLLLLLLLLFLTRHHKPVGKSYWIKVNMTAVTFIPCWKCCGRRPHFPIVRLLKYCANNWAAAVCYK